MLKKMVSWFIGNWSWGELYGHELTEGFEAARYWGPVRVGCWLDGDERGYSIRLFGYWLPDVVLA